MKTDYKIPITAVTVFGISSLLAISVGFVLYLGFDQAVNTTRQLWAFHAETLIGSMEQSLESELDPVREQANWVAAGIDDLSNMQAYDDFIYGAIAATPQVEGVALVRADGMSRRWLRNGGQPIDENWSGRADINAWLDTVNQQSEDGWHKPIWVEAPLDKTTLLHDIAIRNTRGEFIGLFAQIVPVAELSSFLSVKFAKNGLTPFVLYDRQYVLAHPRIVSEPDPGLSNRKALLKIEELGDMVLTRIWAPDDEQPFFSDAMTQTQVSGVYWGDDYYLYLYREHNRYGLSDWTIGAYVNTTIYGGSQIQQLNNALLASLLILIVAIVAAIILGRKISKPIKAIDEAAHVVESGSLENVPVLQGSNIRELNDASVAFNNMVTGLNERKLIRETLGRFVPEKVASSLLAGGGQIEPLQTNATILFCDIESFTQLTESLGPVKIVEVLNTFFSAMVEILERHDGVVTQFQGDAILATFNVPISNSNHAANAINAAQDMLSKVASTRFADEELNIRIGINTGPIVAGAIGAEGRLSYTVHGDAVNLAARLESLNKKFATRLLISEYTTSLTDEFEFQQVGESAVRGQSQVIRVYTLPQP